MTLGLGTGSTVAYFLPALARRGLSLRCVASSVRTVEAARGLGLSVESFDTLDRLDREEVARVLGLSVEPFDRLDRLDLVIVGADQIAPDGWLIKGGGGAHTREKVLAAAADRVVIIADSSKPVAALHPPIPVEILAFGLTSTLRLLQPVTLREAPRSPDGGVIADHHGALSDPAELARWLDSIPGLVGHGLFPPALVSEVLIAHGESVERRRLR
jgi:ribose 5-phosphate isomerase A